MTYMYGIAITYGLVSLLLLGGFAYITFKMTSKKFDLKKYLICLLQMYLNCPQIKGNTLKVLLIFDIVKLKSNTFDS